MKSMYRHAPRIDRSRSAAAPARQRPGKTKKSAKKPAKKAAKKSSGEGRSTPRLPWRPTLWLFGALAAVTVVTAAALVGWRMVESSDRLAVKHIEIAGAQASGAAAVLAYAGVREGQSILTVKLDEAATNIRRHPWVADATVVRVFPDTVKITVREHRPAALVILEGLYLVNAQGEVFKRWGTNDPRALPLVTGLDREAVTREPEKTRHLLQRAIGLAEELDGWLDTVGELEEVHYDEALGWSVVTRPAVADGEPVTLALGMEPHARVALAARSLIELGRRSLTPAVVWADGRKHPTRVQARLRVDESTGNSVTTSEVSQ